MAAPQFQFGQKRWADINSDSDDSVPFFTKTAGVAAGVTRPDDESYILPPVEELDNSKGCINMRLRTAAKDLCPTIAEGDERAKPERKDGENVNGTQLSTRPPADFGSFNETWKPNPDAVDFHPVGLMDSLSSNVTTAASTQPAKINKKRARRVISAGRALLSGGLRRGTAGSSTSIGDNDSVAAESVSSMPRGKRTKKNSVCSDFGSIAGEEELTTEQLEQRVKTREKDVARWKSMGDYNRYLEILPKDKRAPEDPATPDPRTTMTKRKWKFNNEQWQRNIKDKLKFDKEFPSL